MTRSRRPLRANRLRSERCAQLELRTTSKLGVAATGLRGGQSILRQRRQKCFSRQKPASSRRGLPFLNTPWPSRPRLAVARSPQAQRVDYWLAAEESLAASGLAWTEFLNSPVQPQEIALGESVIDGAGAAVRQSNGKSMLEPIETIARRQWRSHLKLEIRQIDRGCICHVHPVVADKSGFCWNPKLIEGTVQEMTRSPTEVVILNHGARTGQGKPGQAGPVKRRKFESASLLLFRKNPHHRGSTAAKCERRPAPGSCSRSDATLWVLLVWSVLAPWPRARARVR